MPPGEVIHGMTGILAIKTFVYGGKPQLHPVRGRVHPGINNALVFNPFDGSSFPDVAHFLQRNAKSTRNSNIKMRSLHRVVTKCAIKKTVLASKGSSTTLIR